jgi:hypothetical protein
MLSINFGMGNIAVTDNVEVMMDVRSSSYSLLCNYYCYNNVCLQFLDLLSSVHQY